MLQFIRGIARPGSGVWFCLCSMIVLSLLCAPVMASESLTSYDGKDFPPFLVGPGDVLSIYVYGEKDFPDKYMVESSGSIDFPLAGRVRLAGLTQSQAGAAIARHLLTFEKDPQVTVMIVQSNNYNVSILGAVTRPGKYSMLGRPDLLGVLADAGGPTDRAALGQAVLIRGNRRFALPLNRYLYDISSVVSEPLLYPGDAIVVPQSIWPSLTDWGIIAGIITSGVLVAAAIENRP